MKNTDNISTIPNIVVWSWMRTVLKLSGSELLIFSYIFSQTFDSVHRCFTCLSDMESWFGITRQTISRNIDRLAEKDFVVKECKNDYINPMIKHNSYYVNIDVITELCENSDYDSYTNFLDSYRFILKQKFPKDSATIDEYLGELSSWHKNKDITVCITLNELASLMHSEDASNLPISDVLNVIRKSNKKIKHNPVKSYVVKEESQTETECQKSVKLFSEPPKKSKRALKVEWDKDKRAMTNSFVYMRLGGNEELLDLLNKFLDTDNGKSYTPDQWEQQLETLYRYGRTVERMIDGVRTTYMNNYRQLYLIDKSEVDIDLKLNEVERYVAEFGNGNEELKDLLCSYVTEVPKAKSYTVKQFKLSLKQLTNICPTVEEKLASVERSYINAYSALAYPNSSPLSYNKAQSDSNFGAIDIDRKIERVHDFITEGYYQLCDGLEDALIDYVNKTKVGQSMSYDSFCIILDNLRLFCLDDNDKVGKVKLAIQNNSNKFATEDFEETRRIKGKLETRESKARSLDRARMQKVYMEKMKNPSNKKLKDIKIQNIKTLNK